MKQSGMGNAVRPPSSRLQALLDEGLRDVTVEVDYFADPLWARNSGGPIGNLTLNSFESSTQLAADLRSWAQEWETEIAVEAIRPAPQVQMEAWVARCRTLANEVQSELRGLIEVYYAYDAYPDRPVREPD